MDKNFLLKKVLTQKNKDYTFSILFFSIFSVFIFFAIRPSLTTAFSLTKDEKDLQEIDNLYEKQITNIISIQSLFEQERDKIPLFDKTISANPHTQQIFSDIKKAADLNGFVITNLQSDAINLIYTHDKTVKPINISVNGTGSFETIHAFIKTLFNQKRLKLIPKMQITTNKKEEFATQSAGLSVMLNILGYYE
jgi:hypothetical protein